MAKSCGEDDMTIYNSQASGGGQTTFKRKRRKTFTNPYQALPNPMLGLRNQLVLLVWSEADHDTSTIAYQTLPDPTVAV